MLRLRLALLAFLLLAPLAAAQQRVPGETWRQYADVAEAGFDAEALAAARASWEELPSSAFLVIADGAVVASWGEVDRRFMCHSVRKSFLSALYGIYWDRGEIQLNQTMEDLGIDDAPSPLLPREKQARILDLLKARSAVYHPAAYAGRTDSAPRGSIGPGQAFGYNNWDFNTLATILMQITGEDVFEAFDQYFGQPLAMQDWRVSDGYYHYERDKSIYPAYPFRMSARDAARFGLLFAREGMWGEQRILSHHWVARSTALYSIDSDLMGYGFMWWVFRKPSLEQYRGFAALGVGNQMIAVFPAIDVVIVNRANTYDGERTPTRPLIALIDQVLAARTGKPVAEPRLVAHEPSPAPSYRTTVAAESLAPLAKDWQYPPASLGLSAAALGREEPLILKLALAEGHLRGHVEVFGTFAFYLQPDGSLVQEDAEESFYPVRTAAGELDGFAPLGMILQAARRADERGEAALAMRLYRRGLEIAPENEAARAALEALEAGDGD
ncbi:MAG: hypothetical protein CMJ94_07235 [Planctomycetes bacterium]|nr:hypothetical protein [Planctomycetota bacterium]